MAKWLSLGIVLIAVVFGLTSCPPPGAPATFTVTIGALSGGTIVASPTSAVPGTTISVTATASVGKALLAGSLRHFDGSYHVITGSQFSMPAANVTVTAGFLAITPELQGFSRTQSYIRVQSTIVFPSPLFVVLVEPAATDTTVDVASSDNDALQVNMNQVTIPAGQASAEVSLMGLIQSANETLTARIGSGPQHTATVRVADDVEVRALASLTPAAANVTLGGSLTLTVTLDLPAPTGGTVVSLSTREARTPWPIAHPTPTISTPTRSSSPR